jgi:AcrR family transcriptional regulator
LDFRVPERFLEGGVMAQRVRSRAASTRVALGGALRRGADEQRFSARIASRGGLPRAEVAEIQRSRLLIGAVGAIEEYGYAEATVARITARARVSRRTFYELFDDREACLAALIEEVVVLLEHELAGAHLDGLPWCERVRGGLLVILSFFDREPVLARICVVEGLRGGPSVLARREEILARAVALLAEGRNESSRASDRNPLIAEGLAGAAFGIVHARLSRGAAGPLSDLLGELMGIIVLPYLGPAAARREQTRPLPAAARGIEHCAPALTAGQDDPLQGIPMRLTYRTARVLQGIAEHPGINNRQVAEHAGIQDQGQISKLLARLQRLGLMTNTGEGHAKGEPNAWRLTALGGQVARRLNMNPSRQGVTTTSKGNG